MYKKPHIFKSKQAPFLVGKVGTTSIFNMIISSVDKIDVDAGTIFFRACFLFQKNDQISMIEKKIF